MRMAHPTQHIVQIWFLALRLTQDLNNIENGKLGDIAPTILQIMGVEIPTEMTGEILIK